MFASWLKKTFWNLNFGPIIQNFIHGKWRFSLVVNIPGYINLAFFSLGTFSCTVLHLDELFSLSYNIHKQSKFWYSMLCSSLNCIFYDIRSSTIHVFYQINNFNSIQFFYRHCSSTLHTNVLLAIKFTYTLKCTYIRTKLHYEI